MIQMGIAGVAVSMRTLSSSLLILVLAAGCGGDEDAGVDGGADAVDAGVDAGVGPTSAAPYINRDTDLATENVDVNMDSSCGRPDLEDTQALSDSGQVNRNVHIDACLFGADGEAELDGQATFESSGVGFISACPDPDTDMDGANGPKTATASDTDGDTLNDRCVQSGYEEKDDVRGDREFHARFNSDAETGVQTVVFCHDSNGDGCADETVTRTIAITWQ